MKEKYTYRMAYEELCEEYRKMNRSYFFLLDYLQALRTHIEVSLGKMALGNKKNIEDMENIISYLYDSLEEDNVSDSISIEDEKVPPFGVVRDKIDAKILLNSDN